MASLALLNHVLTLFPRPHDPTTTAQIHGTCATLLSSLSNPLNIAVLSAQLLSAPALWHQQPGLAPSLAVLSIFHTAAARTRAGISGQDSLPGGLVSCDAWLTAVLSALDARSARWQHVLVLTGTLLGFSSASTVPAEAKLGSAQKTRALSPHMRAKLQDRLLSTANLALLRPFQDGPLAADSLVLALAYAQPQLPPPALARLNASALLPVIATALAGSQAFDRGSFLRRAAADMRAASPAFESGGPLCWDVASPSFTAVQSLAAQPLVANLGPLATLAAYTVREHAASPAAVLDALDQLVDLSAALWTEWAATPLAALEPVDEPRRFTAETASQTAPVLRAVLQRFLFAAAAILNAIMSRCVLDRALRSPPAAAAKVARSTLLMLRNLSPISTRDGNAKFQIYRFTYLAAVDVLAQDAQSAAAFLAELKAESSAATPGAGVPADVPMRLRDLFLLNLAEHVSLILPTHAAETLIIEPANVYLTHAAPASPLMRELYEAAHSAVLSVLSCPHHAALASTLIPAYAGQLLGAFPQLISPRQFRLAFRTVLGITSAPFAADAVDPGLGEALAEAVRRRALLARTGTAALPAQMDDAAGGAVDAAVSEQTGLLLALVDGLPALRVAVVEQWLGLVVEAIGRVADDALRRVVVARFMQVLESGELDVERSMIAVSWWARGGGRQLQKQARRQAAVMSGAATGLRDGSHL